MKRIHPWFAPAFGLLLLAGVTGCDNDSNTDLLDSPDTQIEIEGGALPAAIAAPGSDAIGDLIVGMMNLVDPGVQPATRESTSRGLPEGCPAQFDLGNGITGTCSASQGVVTFAFGGSLDAGGFLLFIDGSLVASPAANQPPSGSAYNIDYDASSSSELGTATWSSLGTVTRNAEGQVTDYTFNMTHSVTPPGGLTSTVTTVLGPTQLEVIQTGPLGGTVRFVLDRETMDGSIYLGSTQVAQTSFDNGCVNVDFISPVLTDVIVCPSYDG